MGFDNIRLRRTVNHVRKRAADPCLTGGFYKSPTNAQRVDSATPLNVTWDTSCLKSKAVDIYLYAPGASETRLHVWETVNYLLGSYQATLMPKWWNATSSVQLQLGIVEAGSPPFASSLPAGPVFTATYTKPASGAASNNADTSTPDSAITQVNNFSTHKKTLAGGKTAAAVIMPLLLVILLIASYFKISRARGKAERKRWSQAIDKRMSTISTDWKSMSAAGASAAIRNSIAIPGTSSRNSSFSFGAIRPASTSTVDGGQAGIGARNMYTHDNVSADGTDPQMSQRRPGARATAFGERVSRVSFAADPRPSVESRRTVASRAFHTSFAPPVPQLDTDGNGSTGSMSPTQTQGPLTLTSDDIRARINGQHTASASVDEVMPALSMMRHGGEGMTADSDYLFNAPASPPLPQPPTPTHPKSPVGMMPMQPMPANVMSPDDMLRAYAERRQTIKSAGAISYPAPIANYNGNGMRTLYSPTLPTTPSSTMTTIGTAMDRQSVAQTIGSRYSDDVQDAYDVGTAE